MKTKVSDLVDLEKVSELLEGFYKTTGFVTAILDLEGNVLSKSGWRQICTDFHRVHPESSKRCTLSDTLLADKMEKGEKYRAYTCLNGLTDVAVPLKIHGQHVANLFSGQFFFEEPDVDFFKKQAITFDFNEKEYIDALRKVPVVSEETVKTAMDFLLKMTDLISELGVEKTEQAELNKILKESENKYRTIFNSTGTVTMLVRNNTYIEMANDEAERVTGFTAEELAGTKWTDHVAPHSLDKMMHYHKIRRSNPGIAPSQYEVDLIHKSGEIRRSLLTIGMIPHSELSIVTLIDITESYKATQKLKESEEKLNEAQQLSHVGSWEYFTENHVVDWSRELYNIFEIPYDLPAPKFSEQKPFYTKESFSKLEKVVQECVTNGTPYEVELDIIASSGAIKQIISKGKAKKDSDNNVIGTYGTALDITKRKKMEQELIEAKEKAEESDRLKSAFLANMSHEIRTPMNGILGFTDLLKEPQLDGDRKERYLQVIEGSGKRMLDTINDIIDISKIESGQVKVEKSVFSVNRILDEQFSFFQREANSKGLELIYNTVLPEKNSSILTDQHKLEGILINLIKNAIKYTNQGEIEMGCALKDNKDSKHLEFFVRDTGLGIPSDRIDHIFNRFEQADIEDKKAMEGSGLGLAISKSYVEMLGGEISVKSKEGEGSTFTFTIPYATRGAYDSAEKNPEKMELQAPFKNASVIIAEDDADSQLFFQTILRNNFDKIICTATGKETIEALKENPNTSIILMDIKMPEMNGHDATREIRKFNQDIKIIAQTAYGLSGDAQKALDAGCDDYISKPIKKEILFDKIRACMDKKKHVIE